MRLAADDRARIPFALVGVLLLVSATTIATMPSGEGHVERNAALAEDRAIAAAETAVRDAIQAAGAEAAAAPVVEPANTTVGRVLDVDRPFRSYLELLIYRSASQRLVGVEERVGEARAGASLALVENASGARDAVDRTTVEAVGNGSVRVAIEDVEIVVIEDGRVVDRSRRTIETTVATPALTLHDRTAAFEEELNRGPIAGSGLGVELTGRLYAIGWTRGNAQYWGAPIEEVIAHRHVELSTAGAILDLQRSTYGMADREGEQGLARATAQVASEDLLPAEVAGLAAAGLPDPNAGPNASREIAAPEVHTTVVGVNETADRAFDELLAGGGRDLDAVLADAYALEGRIATQTRRRSVRLADADPTPGGGWRIYRTRERLRVTQISEGRAPVPTTPRGWTRIDTFERVADVERTVIRSWTDGENRTTTRTRYEEVHAIGVAVLARAADAREPPERPVRDLRSPADPPDGGTGSDGWERVYARLVEERGGPDAIARRAVTGDVDRSPESVRIDVPDGVRAWVYDDLARLREEVRGVSVETGTARLAVGADPPNHLAAALREQRDSFVDAPAEYRNRADRARVAARAAFLDRTLDQLDETARDLDAVQRAVTGELERLATVPQTSIDRVLAAGVNHVRPEPQPLSAEPPRGELSLVIDAEPAHPTREEVAAVGPRGELPGDPDEGYYPMAIRTVNVASLPTEPLADAVVDRLFADADRVPLPIAARALADAERVPSDLAPVGFEEQREVLRTEVERGVEHVTDEAVDALAEPTGLPRTERARAVAAGLERWDDPAARALAMHDGSAADAIAEEVAYHTPTDAPDRLRDRLATRLRVTFADALAAEDAGIPEGPVTDVVDGGRDATRAIARDTADRGADALKERIDDRLGGGLSMTPAGIPVLPKPGLWWATINVWTVEVEGRYAALSVRTRDGAPETGGHVTYVRDGSTVRVDVTGDGERERLGRASRVSFETWTTVVVAVPPGRTGVGDVDGEPLECSEGWPGSCAPGG